MIDTHNTALPDVEEIPSRAEPLSEAVPPTDIPTVDALCHILARIVMRVNTEQPAQTVQHEGGEQ